ncbi:MAG TPA: hypothetical protein VEN29_21700 [Casimicrobiaceae bacterium]|nr:hypothetical protein [Casimicrobiaceae bacterium]
MPLGTAIRHLKKGEWDKAHAIVQQDESKLGCWAHGIVHMVEGDLGNSRYWYRRAGRPFPKDRDVDREVAELVAALKSEGEPEVGFKNPEAPPPRPPAQPRNRG